MNINRWDALNNRGAAVDGKDHKGERAIDVAARAGFINVVETLLENGADANSQTNNGRSWYAHSINHSKITQEAEFSPSSAFNNRVGGCNSVILTCSLFLKSEL